ncbi:hypothetical protein N836_23100 [Leptolyngbya sp. Heron Island J]|uniref:hypothetical protein n=1 Tax=Leptolyngbya sp. Heron Island J TaxID=1385935 RepID=UPI0003B995F7|nr:hypothetical protein [Leptolyngbya sp. Heron Island J]ESA32954.1 hypothetical protein N836_23100 [Leptolyngbya sp. Heron Island J]
MISSLFVQFRHQYTDGSLTTELLTTHAEHYLVKATVTIGEKAIATALAADPNLAAADDQAKARALAMLGFSQETVQATKNGLAIPQVTPQTSAPVKKPVTPPAAASHPPVSEESALDPEPEVADSEDIGRPIDSITPDEAPAPAEVPASSLAAAAIENFDDTHPVDLSDIIAQTDVEMARLGWSSVQGRNYLEQTFNKRSRQQLTDEELLTFLLYLESQATPSIR